MSTLDMERVEVLRGPQGTLFGKNTTGGAINVISAKPGPDFESSITLRAADYGQQDLRAMINAPINDTISTRFSYANENTGWQAWPYDQPFHVILNIAVGGMWGRSGGGIDDKIFPQRMEVDYVRVYDVAEPSGS